MNENMDYRRFKIINEQQKEAFESLVTDKNLSREDLLLILTTVTLNYDTYPLQWQEQT
jgi:hypothetical protein